jgi:hypothetical protein
VADQADAEGWDITVLCGFRGEDDQNDAFRRGTSDLRWPKSKHNQRPSRAVDLAPYPIDWHDIPRFERLRKLVKATADKLGIKIRHISWDYPHTELA